LYIFASDLNIYAKKMNKKDRHSAIREIISSQGVESQGELLKILAGKGFDLTQATLSRDIKELKIGRIPTGTGSYVYQSSNELAGKAAGMQGLSAYGFLGIEFSGNLAVVKTRPGYAMSIAAEIDEQIPQEIIGTIAGDDAILLVIRENVGQEEVKHALNKLIYGK
jgi:transcriptional regulator of arginine metabolism